MDDPWHIKWGSSWPPPSSLPMTSAFVPSQSPPQLVAASQVPVPGNQKNMNSNQHFHPFLSQEASLEDHAFVQEPMVFSTLNLGSCEPIKTELGNSFLALLSGPSNNYEYEIPQLSKSRPSATVSKFSVHDSGTVVTGVGCGLPIKSVAASSEHYRNNIAENGAEFSSFVSSRPLSTSACSRAPVWPHSVPVAGSNFHGSKSSKPICFQALQGNGNKKAISPLRHGWSSVTSPPDASQHHIQILPKEHLEAKSTMPYHASSLIRGGPRVNCMGTVGELFVSDKGLLGVFCLCHNLRMSVAKFCEHSGLHSSNPGNAVHLQNGETIAQWRKLFFLNNGIRVPDDGNGWEWSDGIYMSGGLIGSKAYHLLNSCKNSEAIQRVQQSGGIGRSKELSNAYTTGYHPHMGQTSLDKLLNKVADITQLKNSLEGNSPFLKSFTGLTQNGLPVPANNHTMQVGTENRVCMGLAMSKSSSDKGPQNSRHQLVADHVHFNGKGEDPFISYSSSGTLKSFGRDFNIRRGGFSSDVPSVERDAAFSNIELRLGQPSQQYHTFASSLPETMRPQQFEAQLDSVKPPLNHLQSQSSVVHRVTEGPRQNIRCSPLESSTSNKNMLHHANGSANVIHSSEHEEPKANIDKNSLISLFISQLGTYEGNKTYQAPDTVVLNNEHFLPCELDGDSLSSKCNSSNFLRNTVNAMERKLDISGFELPNQLDKGKGLRSATDNESYNAEKANSVFQTKPMEDSRGFSQAVDGHHLHIRSAPDTRPYPYLHQSSGILLDAPDARSSDHFGKTSYFGKVDHHDHGCLRSANSVPSASAKPGFLPSSSPMSLCSTNSIYMSDPISSLPNKQNIDVSQHFLGEKLRFLALRHIVELSKECSLASHEMNPQQGTLCCPAAMEMQREGIKEDVVACEELCRGSYCCIKQDASKFAVRSLTSCLNCYAGGGNENSGVKTGITSKRKCCNHATPMQGVCSSQHVVQCPPCRVCGPDEQPLLRLGRFQSGKVADSNEHEMCSQKVHSAHRPISCGCNVVPKCLTGCCKSRGGHSEALKEHNVCGKSQIHLAPAYDIHIAPQDGNRIAEGQCDGPKNHVILNTNCQSTMWRDVPRKLKGKSFATFCETPPKVLQPTKNVADQLTDAAAKEFDGTCQVAESLKEQQMSNAYSGCSAPAVTEVSVEINNLYSSNTAYGAARENDFVADEESGIEKCGSSDEVHVNKKCEDALTGNYNLHSINVSYCVPYHLSGDLIDESNLENSCKLDERRNQFRDGHIAQESHTQCDPKVRIAEKRNRSMKWKGLDASVTASELSPIHSDSPSGTAHSELQFPSPNGVELSRQPDNKVSSACIYSHKSSRIKRKRSSLSAAKTLSWKRVKDTHNVQKNGYQMQSIVDCFERMPKCTAGKKAKQFLSSNGKNQIIRKEDNSDNVGKLPKYISLGGLKSSSSHEREPSDKKVRPVVCGNSGIIFNGDLCDQPKPAKFVSLSLILKYARRCTADENEPETRLTSNSDIKKLRLGTKKGSCTVHTTLKKQEDKKVHVSVLQKEINPSILNIADRHKRGCSKTKEGSPDELSVKKERDNGSVRTVKSSINLGCLNSQFKSRCKETRKRSLNELTGEVEHASKPASLYNLGGNEHYSVMDGTRTHSTKVCSKKIAESSPPTNSEPRKSSQDNGDHADELRDRNVIKWSGKWLKWQPSLLDSDAFCCVCGSSNKDEANHLLECSHCFIRVHQACYGVSRIPKGRWCCRPCRINSRNVACVLCGYEGGAMTRALKTRNIVKSLLKVWKVGTGSECMKSSFSSRSDEDVLCMIDQSAIGEAAEFDILESIPSAASKIDPQKKTTALRNINCCQTVSDDHNSITAGVLDPTLLQWVHMVCGLWTPGTRCPNVDTMSAFDVSGVSPARKNTVCSICKRSGGSCIECRVVNCSVHFHPWCAHQKGLLQSEVEGIDNEKVGFYGRCVLHATHHSCQADSPVNLEAENARTEGFTCARMQSYKGRKREEGFCYNLLRDSSDSGGYIVPQEQINAWLHINGQKPCTGGLLKLPASDSEYDCRKEYARYKQAKGWKRLVVYKSGIHALGLYTSQFISCGAMVVEYVGEIVGLRVADKRETEYQSGRKLQYKSACYFFRIDKEHIIDATRKGGIARFVNHSCLPNCVAKVISVRNEKKVVFFAERDINPGEEITYDYHFNHEDEGKKIPCFCKSKNCRRYLN